MDKVSEQNNKNPGDIATEQQRDAANPRHSVWVEASAGTGKTKVLSDRVLRLLLNGVNPIRLLCLTYTKAAAAEMRSRISERLSEWAVESEAKLDEHLEKLLGDEFKSAEDKKRYRGKARTLFAKLLDAPGGIKVQTIHSFCTDVLKRFPLEAGISPYFSVLEENEIALALNQIKNEVIQSENFADDMQMQNTIAYLMNNVSEYTFADMIENIVKARKQMVRIMEEKGGLQSFLTALSAKLGTKDEKTDEVLLADFMDSLRSKESEIRADIKAYTIGGGARDKDKAENLAVVLAHNFDVADYEKYRSSFLNGNNKIYGTGYGPSVNAQAADAALLNRFTAEGERLEQFEQKRQKCKLYQSTKAAFMLAREINRRYEEYKQARSCMDFDDLIRHTQNLLQKSDARQWVLYKLDGGIDHILVDEAQDTSPAQWDIIEKLSDDFFSGNGQKEINRTIFVVGDRKQSIFSFQGADPTKFDEMSALFEQKVKAANQEFKPVSLDISFRSAPAVLDAVNQIFATPQAADGVLVGNKKMDHKPYRVGQFAKVTILPLMEPEKGQKTEDDSKYLRAPTERVYKTALVTLMAEDIAHRIRLLIDEHATDEKPLHYRDIMVLVSKRGNFVSEFIRACEKERVSISGADRMKLSAEIAAQDLVSLGKFLLFPQDDLSLAEVLTSPIFSIREKLLEDLCYERPKGVSLWSSLQSSEDFDAKEITAQLKTLFDNLDYIRPYELFNYVLSDLKKRGKFIERMGQEVEDALDEFINMTLDYEQSEIPTLQGFISWFEQTNSEIKRESDDDETDAVRLLTVHHSKGLQAPIVFLPCAGNMPKTDQGIAFLQDDDLGYYPLNKSYYDDICCDIHQKDVEKTMQEYHRLLYVALTRAEDRLFISAFGKRNAQSWYELCRRAFDDVNNPTTENIEIISEEKVAKEIKKKSILKQKAHDFSHWLDEDVSGKEDNLAKPYTPSKDDEEAEEIPDSLSPLKNNGFYYRRGTLIHRLLQFLPASEQNKEKILDDYLQKNAEGFSAEDCTQIKKEVLALLNNPEFADIFGADSRAEVPVVGVVKNKIISAQLDRLIVLPDKIKIVDFKTNRPPAKDVAHTSPQYIKQLAAYAELMQKVYPDKPVETYILWTNETRLMRVA